jgi:HK97 family phage prohead protease
MTTNNIERRFSAELRVDTAAQRIVGYAAKYDLSSEDLGGFREFVRPGAFQRSLDSAPDVRALIDHNPSLILGRTVSGTLKLESDAIGLKVTIDPPDTQYAADLMAVMSRGDVSQMSFAFTTSEDSWDLVDGQRVRSLLAVELHDVSVVTYPAYPDTTVAVRSLSVYTRDALASARRFRELRLRRQQ